MAGNPRKRARLAALIDGSKVSAGESLDRHEIKKPRAPKRTSQLRARHSPVDTGVPDVLKPSALDTIDASFGASLAVALDSLDMNTVFEELRGEAMRFALEVMRMPLDPDERSFNKLLSVKQQITTAVLTATTRIRPGDLREREDDGLGKLLAKVKAEGRGPTKDDLLN